MKSISMGMWGLVLLLPMLVGCGVSVPTERDAKEYVEKYIAEENFNRLKLVSFQKTNGQQSVVNGVPRYSMEYKCEAEVTEPCGWAPNTTRTQPLGNPMAYVAPSDVVKKGVRRPLLGRVDFEKTENGWRATGGANLRSP